MKPIYASFLILAFLLISCSFLSIATPSKSDSKVQPSTAKPSNENTKAGGGGVNNDWMGGPFGPGFEFGIPGWGNGIIGGGYGVGYGGPNGGYAKGVVARTTVVCKDRGPCYKKRLTCPAKCFSSYSRAGKDYGAGSGGGGCNIDCKKCIAYC